MQADPFPGQSREYDNTVIMKATIKCPTNQDSGTLPNTLLHIDSVNPYNGEGGEDSDRFTFPKEDTEPEHK